MVMFIMCLIIAVIDATFAVAKRRQGETFLMFSSHLSQGLCNHAVFITLTHSLLEILQTNAF